MIFRTDTPLILNEQGLDQFRATTLSPENIRSQLLGHPLIFRLALGLGKSTAVDQLLQDPATFRQFDLVLYVAPSWNIITERVRAWESRSHSAKGMALKPRPNERCGSLNAEWIRLERQGCSGFAKASICSKCPRQKSCTWPASLRSKLKDVQAIFCTEQHFINDPTFLLRVKFATKQEKILLIFDEAKLTHCSFESKVSVQELLDFSKVLKANPHARKSEIWLEEINRLLLRDEVELARHCWNFPLDINWDSEDIQRYGVLKLNRNFRYLGYALANFAYSRSKERWWGNDQQLHFISRPFLKTQLLILSAHLRVDYIERRLGLPAALSPFEKMNVRHTGTRIFNIKNSSGAECYFNKNQKTILDFFARLVLRNIARGKSTILVSRKNLKGNCAEYLQKRLRGWGIKAFFPCDPKQYSKLKKVSPTVVPIIHYGIAGINDFAEYETCYCLNSYYISDMSLNGTLQSAEPDDCRIEVRIRRDSQGNRRATIPVENLYSELERLGNQYLQILEVDPVLQAVGRCRFMTKAREVILFQTHDFTAELGDVTEFRSFRSAEAAFNLPVAKALDQSKEVNQLKMLLDQGCSMRQAAKQLGLSKSTASRRLKCAKGVSQKPSDVFNSDFGTPAPASRPGKHQ